MKRAQWTWAVWTVPWLLGPMVAQAATQPYYLRNQNPFLQVFGVPAPEGGKLTEPGRFAGRLVVSWTNHADRRVSADASVELDGESHYVDAVLRFGLAPGWEVGLDLPYVAHRRGVLDELIEDWHSTFGLSNGARDGPSNRLYLGYRDAGVDGLTVLHPGGGIGDVRVTAARRIAVAETDAGRFLALRVTVELPTGDPDRLRGSGATDLAVSVDATDSRTLAARSVELFGQAGVLRAGEGDVLPRQQKELVPFGSLGLSWHWTDRIRLQGQLSAQGRYLASRLDPIGGTTFGLALGGSVLLRSLGLELDVALLEDLTSDATPDFGLHMTLRRSRR